MRKKLEKNGKEVYDIKVICDIVTTPKQVV